MTELPIMLSTRVFVTRRYAVTRFLQLDSLLAFSHTSAAVHRNYRSIAQTNTGWIRRLTNWLLLWMAGA